MIHIKLAVLALVGAATAQLSIVTIDQTTTGAPPVFLPPSGTNLLPVPPLSSSVPVLIPVVTPTPIISPSLASGTSTYMVPQVPDTSSAASFMTIQTQNMSDPSVASSASVVTSTVVLPSSEVSGSSDLPTITKTMTVSGSSSSSRTGSATSSAPPGTTSNAACKKGMGGGLVVALAVMLGAVGV